MPRSGVVGLPAPQPLARLDSIGSRGEAEADEPLPAGQLRLAGPRCRPGSSVARTIIPSGTSEIGPASATAAPGRSPARGGWSAR